MKFALCNLLVMVVFALAVCTHAQDLGGSINLKVSGGDTNLAYNDGNSHHLKKGEVTSKPQHQVPHITTPSIPMVSISSIK